MPVITIPLELTERELGALKDLRNGVGRLAVFLESHPHYDSIDASFKGCVDKGLMQYKAIDANEYHRLADDFTWVVLTETGKKARF